MKKMLLLMLTFTLLFGSVRQVQASGRGSELLEVSAFIFAIDAENRMLTLQDCFTYGYCIDTYIYVTEDTHYLKNPRVPPYDFDDLHAGDWVTVRYYVLNGRNYAWSISIKS